MESTKRTGRQVGLLFLFSFIFGATGTALRDFSGLTENATEFLLNLTETAGQMKLAIYLDMLASAVIVGLAIFLFPIIKKYKLRSAVTYLAIACISFVTVSVSNLMNIALLSVGADIGPEASGNHHATLAVMLYDSYYWVHFLMLILYSIGGSVLYYFLLKARLVPNWLAIWGLLASAIVFIGGALQLAEIAVPFELFVQNGIFMLVFILWLLVKGFRTKRALG